jgi:hypothetical protein
MRAKILNREYRSVLPNVRGTVMEWGIGSTSAVTLVAMDDGTTSLYFSSGGAMLGLGGRPTVKALADAFRARVAAHQVAFSSTDSFPPPPSGNVVFYLLGDSATLSTGPLTTGEVERESHPLAESWWAGQALISGIRKEVGWLPRSGR